MRDSWTPQQRFASRSPSRADSNRR
ncbi:MAG: hypothetical protein ACLPVY_10480 [Acidimicrobiia bacterium]